MSTFQNTTLVDGDSLEKQIVAAMQAYPILGDHCEDPVYLLRYTDSHGIGQYADGLERCWMSTFTTSCKAIQKLIGSPLVDHLFSTLWVVKINPDFFFGKGERFTNDSCPTFPITLAELHLKPPGWEVIFYGVIPPGYLYSQPFVVGTDCHW